MKKVLIGLSALALPVLASAADITGNWQTEPNDRGISGIVQIAPCGDAFCGVMIGNTENTDRFKGQTIISGMTSSDGVNFSGGQITDPEEGKSYKSKMTLSDNSLKVEGCILAFCRAQTWMRIQ